MVYFFQRVSSSVHDGVFSDFLMISLYFRLSCFHPLVPIYSFSENKNLYLPRRMFADYGLLWMSIQKLLDGFRHSWGQIASSQPNLPNQQAGEQQLPSSHLQIRKISL
jgi:hypothetical protein